MRRGFYPTRNTTGSAWRVPLITASYLYSQGRPSVPVDHAHTSSVSAGDRV